MMENRSDSRDSRSVDEVMTLLREQALLYGKLESFAARQRSLVASEDVQPLLSALADRRKISEALARTGTQLMSIRQDWTAYRRRMSEPERAEAERLLAEASERLQRVIESDEHDARVLSARKQTVAAALQATHSASQAISAYRGPSDESSRLDCVNEGNE